MLGYSDPNKPAIRNDLEGGVVGVSVLVDLDIAIKKEQSFLNPQNHLNRLGGKEMRALQIILVIYPRISTPFFQ